MHVMRLLPVSPVFFTIVQNVCDGIGFLTFFLPKIVCSFFQIVFVVAGFRCIHSSGHSASWACSGQPFPRTAFEGETVARALR